MAFLRENLVALVSALLTFAVTFTTIQSTVGFNSRRGEDHEMRLRNIELHGSPSMQDRVTRLESQRADALAVAVKAQGEQIHKLAEIVRQDHDSIVKLTTLLETRR
jgi:hypothetical protein